jgi:hypothetical protein
LGDRAGKLYDGVHWGARGTKPRFEKARRPDIPCIGWGFDMWRERGLVPRHRRD